MPDFMIYGANGYTGSLIAREAVRRGTRPILAGRQVDKIRTLAAELGLSGLVGNDADGVFAEVEGTQAAVDDFVQALRTKAPPLNRLKRPTTVLLGSFSMTYLK